MDDLRIVFLGNASAALVSRQEAWVIDALQEGAGMYEAIPDSAFEWLADFKGALHFIITHNHSDHFSAKQFSKLASIREFDVVCFDEEVEDELNQALLSSEHSIDVDLLPIDETIRYEKQGKPIALRGISTPHLSPETFPLKHVAISIRTQGKHIFFTADSNFDGSVYEKNRMHIYGCDVCVAIYAYGFTRKNLEFMEKYIAPKKVIFNHLPNESKDEHGIRSSFKRFSEKNNSFDYAIAASPRMSFHFLKDSPLMDAADID